MKDAFENSGLMDSLTKAAQQLKELKIDTTSTQ